MSPFSALFLFPCLRKLIWTLDSLDYFVPVFVSVGYSMSSTFM